MFFPFSHCRATVRRCAYRIGLTASTVFLLLPIGCTTTGASQLPLAASSANMEHFLTAEQIGVAPSAGAEAVFAQLLLDQGLRSNDRTAILDGATRLLTLPGKSKGQSPAASIVDAAIWLFSNDFPDDAASLVEKACTAFQDDLPLAAMRADLLIRQEQPEPAVQVMQDFVRRHPDNALAQAELAVVLLKGGRSNEALSVFQRIPAKQFTPPLRFTYAQALNSARRFSEAETQLRAAVKEAPDYAEAWQLLALTLEERGDSKEALDIYQRILSSDPGNRSARIFLLRSHLRRGDSASALSAIQNSPDPLHFAVAASSLLVEEKRFADAENLLEKLSKTSGIPEGIYFYHAALLYEVGTKAKEALPLLEKVTEASEEYEKAQRLKVQLLCDLEQFPQALEAVKVVQRLNPEDAEPLLLMGELCCRLKRYDEAENVFTKALALFPDNEQLHFRNAYLRELQGDRAGAMALMEKVVAQFPNHAMALNYVGYNLADSGKDLERALALIQRAAELEPEADFIIDSLAWAHFRLGHVDEAWLHIQRAVGLNENAPRDPSMLEHFGDIAFARGDADNARSGWQASEEIFLKLNLKNDARRIRTKLENLK